METIAASCAAALARRGTAIVRLPPPLAAPRLLHRRVALSARARQRRLSTSRPLAPSFSPPALPTRAHQHHHQRTPQSRLCVQIGSTESMRCARWVAPPRPQPLPPGASVAIIKVAGDPTVTNADISALAQQLGELTPNASLCVAEHVDSLHSPVSIWNVVHQARPPRLPSASSSSPSPASPPRAWRPSMRPAQCIVAPCAPPNALPRHAPRPMHCRGR